MEKKKDENITYELKAMTLAMLINSVEEGFGRDVLISILDDVKVVQQSDLLLKEFLEEMEDLAYADENPTKRA